MKFSLLVTGGVHEGKVIDVKGVYLLIGRDPQCHLRPVSPEVGPRHCALLVRGDKIFVRDLSTKVGTIVNDRQLRGELELREGDFLQVGPLMFVVQLEADSFPQSSPTGPAEEQLSTPVAETIHEVPGVMNGSGETLDARLARAEEHFSAQLQALDDDDDDQNEDYLLTTDAADVGQEPVHPHTAQAEPAGALPLQVVPAPSTRTVLPTRVVWSQSIRRSRH